MRETEKSIKQIMQEAHEYGADDLSGNDLIDLLSIGEEFNNNHPDEARKLTEGFSSEPIRPEELGGNIIQGLKFAA